MAIDQEAIERFLAADLPPAPQVKGRHPDELQALIHAATGRYYQHVGPAPRTAQLEGLALALCLRRSLLFFGMRMGKTKIGFDFASHLRKAGMWKGPGLVIAHAPIGVGVWEGQSRIHSDLNVRGVLSGPTASDDFVDRLVDGTDLTVVSWPTLRSIMAKKRPSGRDRKGPPKLYADKDALLDAAEFFDLVIVDEIHVARNALGLNYDIGRGLAQCATYTLGLTGTPHGRDQFSVWAQASIIGREDVVGRSYFFFEAAFGKKQFSPRRNKNHTFEYVFDKAKESILARKLASISLSYRLQDVQDVNILSGEVLLSMAGEQRAAYDAELDHLIALHSGKTDEVRNSLMRMRQISSGFINFVDDYGLSHTKFFKESCKIEWLRDFIDALDGERIRVVIFHEFVAAGKAICELLEKRKISHTWLWGGAKDKDAAIAAFQTGKVEWLVANVASGGMAIDLPMADYLLFFESPTDPITRQQCEARPLGRGEKPLVIDDLIASPTDKKVLGFVKEGKDALLSLIHGKDRKSLGFAQR